MSWNNYIIQGGLDDLALQMRAKSSASEKIKAIDL